MIGHRRSFIAFLAYVILAVLLRASWGGYHPGVLFLVAASLLAVSALALSRNPDGDFKSSGLSDLHIAMAIASFAYLAWDNAGLDFAVVGSASQTLSLLLGGLLALALLGCIAFLLTTPWSTRIVCFIFGTIGLGCIVSRFLVPAGSPEVGIDVLVIGNLASDYLLSGFNPYTATYPDIYRGLYDYRPAAVYWPAYYLWTAPFYGLFGDVRYATAAADSLIAPAIFLLARRRSLPTVTSLLVAVAWLANPLALFVVERAWVDSVLMLGIATAALAFDARRWLLLGVLLGVTACVKHYGMLAFMFAVVLLLARQRGALKRTTAAATVTVCCLFVPFLSTGAREFYDSSIAQAYTVGLRLDSLSFPAWWVRAMGFEYEQLVSVPIYASAFTLSAWFVYRRGELDLSHWVGALLATLSTVFLFGKLAFCNYYFSLTFLVLLYVTLSIRRPAARSTGPPRLGNALT